MRAGESARLATQTPKYGDFGNLPVSALRLGTYRKSDFAGKTGCFRGQSQIDGVEASLPESEVGI
jgi:hypothetical protein